MSKTNPAHLVRDADPKTKRPVVDERGRAPYFVECDNCGRVTKRGLSRRAAEIQRDAHKCLPV